MPAATADTTASTIDRADAFVARQSRRTPLAVELAALASLAARVEPELLRRLRLDFVRNADASVEADLWFGPLVSARSSDGIVLDPALLPALRRRVPSARLHEVAAAIALLHRDAPPLLQLEEALIADLMLGASDVAIDERLRSVLAAMVQDEPRRRGLASWVWTALPRLPLGERALSAVGPLVVATGLMMRTPMSMRAATVPGALDELPPALLGALGTVALTIRRRGDRIVIAHADTSTPTHRRFEVPATTPRYVEIEADGGAQIAAVAPGGSCEVVVRGRAVTVRALGGQAWRIAGRAPAPARSTDAPVEVNLLYVPGSEAFEHGVPDLTGVDLVLGTGVRDLLATRLSTSMVAAPSDDDGWSPASSNEPLQKGVSSTYPRPTTKQSSPLDWVLQGAPRAVDTTASVPGCLLAKLDVGQGSVGIVALDVWQRGPVEPGFHGAMPDGIDAWCAEHDVTILLLGAAPERFGREAALRLRHAIARRGRFDVVIGPAGAVVRRALGAIDGHLEVTALPGPRSIAIRIVAGGDTTHVQLSPRRHTPDGAVIDDDYTGLVNDEAAHVFLPYRRRWPLPPLAVRAAREVHAHLLEGRRVVLWGPPDAMLEETSALVGGHLEAAGRTAVDVTHDGDIDAIRAIDVPRPVFFSERWDADLSGGLFCLRVDGRDKRHPTEVAELWGAQLVIAEDLAIEELQALHPTVDAERIAAVHAETLGAPRVTHDLLVSDERTATSTLRVQLEQRYPMPRDRYRHYLDHQEVPADVPDWRLVGSGLFRRAGEQLAARSPLHERILGHDWLDEQIERASPQPDVRWILVVGPHGTDEDLLRAFGRASDHYALAFRSDTLREQQHHVRAFLDALPPAASRRRHLRILGGVAADVSLEAGMATRYGAALFDLPRWEPDALTNLVDAVVAFRGEKFDEAICRAAERRGLPVWRWNEGGFPERPHPIWEEALRVRTLPPQDPTSSAD